MADTRMPRRGAIRGHGTARIGRLPLTNRERPLAILAAITRGFMICDTDSKVST